MPMPPNRRGLMGSVIARAREADANRNAAMQERAARPTPARQPMPASMAGMPPRPGSGQNTGIVPPRMQPTRGPAPQASLNMPQRPMNGMPRPTSGINPRPGNVMVPDAARGPKMPRR